MLVFTFVFSKFTKFPELLREPSEEKVTLPLLMQDRALPSGGTAISQGAGPSPRGRAISWGRGTAISRGGAWPTPVEGTAVSREGPAISPEGCGATLAGTLGQPSGLRALRGGGAPAHWCCSPSFHRLVQGPTPSQSPLHHTRVKGRPPCVPSCPSWPRELGPLPT